MLEEYGKSNWVIFCSNLGENAIRCAKFQNRIFQNKENKGVYHDPVTSGITLQVVMWEEVFRVYASF